MLFYTKILDALAFIFIETGFHLQPCFPRIFCIQIYKLVKQSRHQSIHNYYWLGAERYFQPGSSSYLPCTVLGKKKKTFRGTGVDDRYEYFIFISSAYFSFYNECRIIIQHDT